MWYGSYIYYRFYRVFINDCDLKLMVCGGILNSF